MVHKYMTLLAVGFAFSPLLAPLRDSEDKQLKFLQKVIAHMDDPVVQAIARIKPNDDGEVVIEEDILFSDSIIGSLFDYSYRLANAMRNAINKMSHQPWKVREELCNKLDLEIQKYSLNKDYKAANSGHFSGLRYSPEFAEDLVYYVDFVIQEFKQLTKIEQQGLIADHLMRTFSCPLPDMAEFISLFDPKADPSRGYILPVNYERILVVSLLLTDIALLDENVSSELLEEFYSSEDFKRAVKWYVIDFFEKTYSTKY